MTCLGLARIGAVLMISALSLNASAQDACAGLFRSPERNTILEMPKTGDVPFRYSEMTDDMIDAAFPVALAQARANIEAIRNNPRPANFTNTIEALIRADEALDAVDSVLSNFSVMASTPARENLQTKWAPETAKFSNSIFFDARLFERIKAVYDRRAELRLTREQSKILENMYTGFLKNGANLTEAQKKRIEDIDSKLVLVSHEFAKNQLGAAKSTFITIRESSQLKGLPADVVAAAKALAVEKGEPNAWIFSLQASTLMKVTTYADDRALREEMWRSYGSLVSKPPFDNRPLVIEIANLRRERAQILGFESYGAAATQDRMAKNPETVLAMIEKLRAKYLPAAQRDADDLLKFARENGFTEVSNGATQLQPWDVRYYAEKLKTERYSFDGEKVRPYLSLDDVHRGSLQAAEKLFNIRFHPVKDADVWDPAVRVYEVRDNKNEKLLGFFYFDPYERAGAKKPGAWQSDMRSAGRWSGVARRAHVINVLNIAPPVGNRPSLLTIDEVRTVFHELGHGLHSLLTQTRYRNTSGTQVVRDFVELPSQLFEEWGMDMATLQSFARHVDTGEVIPTEYIRKIRRADNYRIATFGLGQLLYAVTDMAWYTRDVTAIKNFEDLAAFEESVSNGFRVYPANGALISPSFSHIFSGGYAAGYYSYKWADALVADAFEYFQQNGIYNPKIAHRYRRAILEKGGSQDAAVLYRLFRGQDPDPEAVLRREGLLE